MQFRWIRKWIKHYDDMADINGIMVTRLWCYIWQNYNLSCWVGVVELGTIFETILRSAKIEFDGEIYEHSKMGEKHDTLEPSMADIAPSAVQLSAKGS